MIPWPAKKASRRHPRPLVNDAAIKATGSSPFRLHRHRPPAWSYDHRKRNKAFGRRQSFVAGHPKNGVQFMVKDSKGYASTGGWNYAQFDEGKPLLDVAMLQSCFECHLAVKDHDYVFTRYAP